MALFSRIYEYLDMPHDIVDAPDAVALPKDSVKGSVRFRQVFFRYDSPPEAAVPAPVSPPDVAARAALEGSDATNEHPREWALENVDLEIEPGQLAALVGPSGAGKTTMTYLIPRMYDANEGSVEIDGMSLHIGASMGVCFASETSDADELLRNADVAMYTAKGRGKGRIEIFEASMHAAVVTRLELRADMEHALERGEFRLRYQPVYELACWERFVSRRRSSRRSSPGSTSTWTGSRTASTSSCRPPTPVRTSATPSSSSTSCRR